MTWMPARFALAATTLTLAACNTGPTTGSLVVNYKLGLGSACAQFGVDRVLVDLEGDEYEEDAACDPDEPIVIDGIAAGNYDVLVQGLDVEGIAVMDNVASPTTDDKVEIVGGSERSLDVRLGSTPASVQVRWQKFVEGEFAECAFVETKFFEVTAFHGGTPFFEPHEFPCSVPPGYQTLPDPDRAIDGTTLDGVLVRVLDESHQQIGDDLVFMDFTPPGPGRSVKIDIACDGPATAPVCEIVDMSVGSDTGADTGVTTAGDESGSTG